MRNNNELLLLGKILVEVIESGKGISCKGEDKYIDSEGLALKFFGHFVSTIYLSRGISLPDFHIPLRQFYDPFSVDVVARSAYESCLTFYYVFLDPKTPDEAKFRYDTWCLAGLYERQKFPPMLPENKIKLKKERTLISKRLVKYKQDPLFLSLNAKQQNSLLKNLLKGVWRFKGWNTVAADAGFGKTNSVIIYGLLSDRAHSGNLTTLQAWQAKKPEDRKRLLNAALGHLKICTAFMIMQYCNYLPVVKKFFTANFPEPNIVTLWVGVGRETNTGTIF